MSEERIEVERSEELVLNTNGKKKKRIITIIITVISFLAVMIGVIGMFKYNAKHRYIPFEELDKEYIIAMQVYIESTNEEKTVFIRAINQVGSLYCTNMPYGEWIENEEMSYIIESAECVENYRDDVDVKLIYEYSLQIDENAEFTSLMSFSNGMRTEVYNYVIRYCENGDAEIIKYWEDRANAGCYILDEPGAEEIYKITGRIL